MASGLILEVLVQAIETVTSRISRERSRTVEWLREVTRPPPGLQLHAPDGSGYTGMNVFYRNRAVVVLALRRVRQDRQRSYVDVQSEFSFGHRRADYNDGGDDRLIGDRVWVLTHNCSHSLRVRLFGGPVTFRR